MDNNMETVKAEHFNRQPLPNKAFDMEYQTERWREVQFLAEKGIKYTFVRKTRDYGVSQYKYKKTPALFAALVEFYSILEAEKALRGKKKYNTPRPQEKQEEQAEPKPVELDLSTENTIVLDDIE